MHAYLIEYLVVLVLENIIYNLHLYIFDIIRYWYKATSTELFCFCLDKMYMYTFFVQYFPSNVSLTCQIKNASSQINIFAFSKSLLPE